MEPTEYEFSHNEQAVIQEYEATFLNLQNQLQGALRMIAASRGLKGNWVREGMKLVRQDED